MSRDLANRLNAERHRMFVGRIAERDLFRSALAADVPPFNVLYVSGPGGLGKMTLLREFATVRAPRGLADNGYRHLCRAVLLCGVGTLQVPLGQCAALAFAG